MSILLRFMTDFRVVTACCLLHCWFLPGGVLRAQTTTRKNIHAAVWRRTGSGQAATEEELVAILRRLPEGEERQEAARLLARAVFVRTGSMREAELALLLNNAGFGLRESFVRAMKSVRESVVTEKQRASWLPIKTVRPVPLSGVTATTAAGSMDSLVVRVAPVALASSAEFAAIDDNFALSGLSVKAVIPSARVAVRTLPAPACCSLQARTVARMTVPKVEVPGAGICIAESAALHSSIGGMRTAALPARLRNQLPWKSPPLSGSLRRIKLLAPQSLLEPMVLIHTCFRPAHRRLGSHAGYPAAIHVPVPCLPLRILRTRALRPGDPASRLALLRSSGRAFSVGAVMGKKAFRIRVEDIDLKVLLQLMDIVLDPAVINNRDAIRGLELCAGLLGERLPQAAMEGTIFKAWSFYRLGNPGKGFVGFSKWLQEHFRPENRNEFTFMLARIANKAEDYKACRRLIGSLLDRKDSGTPQDRCLLLLGIASVKLNEKQRARIYLRRLIREYPRSGLAPRALLLMAWMDLVEGETAQASARLAGLIDQYPDTAIARKAAQLLDGIEARAKAVRTKVRPAIPGTQPGDTDRTGTPGKPGHPAVKTGDEEGVF